MIRNPRFGMHPDLFGGETPIVFPIEQLSREEQLSLKRSNLTPEEIREIKDNDEELYEAVISNSPEEQRLAREKCKEVISRAVKSAMSIEEFAQIIKKERDFNDELIEKFSLESLRNPSNWTLRVADKYSNEKCDYEVEFETISPVVDLSEFSLTDWEIEDVGYEVQRENADIDEVEENQEKLRFYVQLPRKVLAYFKLSENVAESLAR